MQEKQNQENTKHTNIKMPIEMYEQIAEMAEKSERTLSQQIRFMLQKAIELMKYKE